MLLLSCRGIEKKFNDLTVLGGIDIDITHKDRIGLVGKNGAGKTTLALIIYGTLQPDQGEIIHHQGNLNIAYLGQRNLLGSNRLQSETFQRNNFYKVTSQLGLSKVQDWGLNRFKHLSGGEKTKLALADIWTINPDLLLLDEPTNHLDFTGIDWLIEQLNHFTGAIIIISHDRYFLDQTINKTIELNKGKVNFYNGNYTSYRQQKKKKYQEKLHQYQVIKKEENKIRQQINQLDNWASKANRDARKIAIKEGRKFGGKEFYRAKARKMDKQVKSKRKRLMKLLDEKNTKKPEQENEISFNFQETNKKGKRIVEAREVSKSFGQKELINQSSFYVKYGERVGIIGENGCGKTTLLRMILEKDKPDNGELWISTAAKFAYLSQGMDELNTDKTVMEVIDSLQNYYNEKTMYLMKNLGFTESMLTKSLNQLSMGEKTRVKLAKILLAENNCLVLDEPTNHLDLYSREELERNLEEYNGTILIVSHDRYLLEKICDCLLVFEDKQLKRLDKTFKEFIIYQRKTVKGIDQKKIQEKLMLIENKLARFLNEVNMYSPEQHEYKELDQKIIKLIEEKRKLQNKQVFKE